MIMVDIYIPALDEIFNVELQDECLVKEVVEEISGMMCKKYKTSYKSANGYVLCSMDTRQILQNNKKLSFYEIKNGSRLLLV